MQVQMTGAAVGRISNPILTLTDSEPTRAVEVKTVLQYGIQIYASGRNTGDVFVGESNVDGTTIGTPIPKGTSLFIPIDDASKVYFKGAADDVLHLMLI